MRWLRILGIAALFVGVLSAQTESGSRIGVLVRDIAADRAQELKLDSQRGVEVVEVESGSPAAEAGIQAHDVLLSYNGENIVGRQQLGRLVSETPPGRHVAVRVWRGGHIQSLTIITTAALAPSPVLIPAFPVASDIPGTVIVWRNRILGTVCETLPPEMSGFFGVNRGVLVRFVDKGALGDVSGLKPGDVIQAASDRPILNPRDLTGALLSDNGTVHAARFLVWRDHKRVYIDVRPTD